MSDFDTRASGLEETLAGDQVPAAGSSRLEPGVHVHRYILERRLGAGAMGVVWAAHDPELDRRLAIKFLAASGSAEERVARLRREAQSMAKLSHPNVVTVHDVGTWGTSIFVAMEYIDGGTLGDWMQASHPLEEVIAVFGAAGRGLHAAHRAGIVHRDFKPDNVLMRSDGRVCVADFGLAFGEEELGAGAVATVSTEQRAARLDPEAIARTEGASSSARLTQTGRFLGTPAYMAPEQHLGRVVDARSDQFAFCVSLWEAIYKKRPFRGDSVLALALQVCEGGPPEFPVSPSIPTWLRRLLLRGLATAPDDRFESMAALVEELERDRGRTRRAIWLGVGGVLALSAAVGTTVALTRSTEVAPANMCESTSEAIDEVWTPARRAAVEARFDASALSFASTILSPVESALDGYATNFAAAKREACERTHERGEQTHERYEAQSLCLDRSLREFDAFVSELERADDELIEHAASSAEKLSNPSVCLDRATTVEPPPQEHRVEVEALYLELADCRALRLAQRGGEARTRLDAMLPRVDEIGYGPLQLATLLEASLATSQQNEAKPTLELLARAIPLAIALEDDAALSRAAAQMIWATGAEAPDELTADLWRDVALANDALPVQTRINVLSEHAATLSKVGQHDKAIAQQREALASWESIRLDYPVRFAHAKVVLGGFLIRAGHFEEANDHIEAGLDELSALVGSEHPSVTPMRLNLGISLFTLGRVDEAVEVQRAVVADYERQYGPDTPKTADARYNLGLYLGRAGKQEEGIEQLQAARAVYAAGGHTVWVAQTDLDLAQLELRSNDPSGAAEKIEDARRALERELGAQSVLTLQAATIALDSLLLTDRDREAARFATEWIGEFRQGLGEDHFETAKFELGMIHALLRDGASPEDVRELLDHARRVLDETELLESPPYSGIVLLVESRMVRSSDVEGARAKAKAAREAFSDPTFAIERAQIDAYLGSLR